MAYERNDDLPDISGIFNIDDDMIPSKIIEKPVQRKPVSGTGAAPANSRRKGQRPEPILLQQQTAKEEQRAYQGISSEAHRRTVSKRKEQQKKLFRRRLILFGAAVALVAALVIAIAVWVSIKNRPHVVITPVQRGSFSDTYEANAIIYTEVTDVGESRTYAVFVDNRYDRETSALKTGLAAEIRISDEVTVTGRLVYIRPNEETTSPIVSLLVSLLPDTDYEPSNNTVIMVYLDDADSAPENATVKVFIKTNEQDNVVIVPLSLVQDPDGEPYLWVYKSFGKKLVKTPVELGSRSKDGNVVVTKGVSAGTPIVCEGDFDAMEDGMKVNAEEQSTESGAADAAR